MKKLIDAIKKALGMDKKSGDSSSGFTLIELLVVIAVIGILAAALLVAIDPVDKVKQGNDTKVLNDVRAIYDGANRVYTNTGAWPTTVAAIATAGELKANPAPPTGYAAYNIFTDANGIVAYGEVQSKVNKCKAPRVTGGGCQSGTVYFILTGAKSCYHQTAPTAATYACP